MISLEFIFIFSFAYDILHPIVVQPPLLIEFLIISSTDRIWVRAEGKLPSNPVIQSNRWFVVGGPVPQGGMRNSWRAGCKYLRYSKIGLFDTSEFKVSHQNQWEHTSQLTNFDSWSCTVFTQNLFLCTRFHIVCVFKHFVPSNMAGLIWDAGSNSFGVM